MPHGTVCYTQKYYRLHAQEQKLTYHPREPHSDIARVFLEQAPLKHQICSLGNRDLCFYHQTLVLLFVPQDVAFGLFPRNRVAMFAAISALPAVGQFFLFGRTLSFVRFKLLNPDFDAFVASGPGTLLHNRHPD